jgi:hypothetical protein
MRNGKWDKVATRVVMRQLDRFARKYGLPTARHAVTKWNTGQQAKVRLAKQREKLEQELAEVNKRLSR